MSAAEAFFGTSVVLYLISGDAAKAERGEELLARKGVISVQVLNEFAAVATRKQALSTAEIREVLGAVRTLCSTLPITVHTHDRGLDIAERYGFSIYDSMIVAAALEAGCRTLYSEDLQHGQRIEGSVAVVNPFIEGV